MLPEAEEMLPEALGMLPEGYVTSTANAAALGMLPEAIYPLDWAKKHGHVAFLTPSMLHYRRPALYA